MATVLCIMATQRGDVSFVQQSMYYPMTDALTSEAIEARRMKRLRTESVEDLIECEAVKCYRIRSLRRPTAYQTSDL